MAIQHSSAVSTAISRLRETAYGTQRLSSDDFRRIISETRAVGRDTLNMGNDAGYETGVDIPTEYWGETSETGFDINPKLNFQDIGYQLDMALGGYSVSGPDGALYTHVFTPQDMGVSRQLPSRTGMKKYGSSLELYPSLVSTAFSITFGKMGRISTSQSFVGNGDIKDNPASYTMPATNVAPLREYGYASQAAGIGVSEAGLGTRQAETATAAGTITGAGNVLVTVAAAGLTGSPIAVNVAVTGTETPAQWAALVRTALRANSVIRSFAEITGAGTSIIATKWAKEANDITFNIALANGTSTGVTAAPTSGNTTAGVAGNSEALGCLIEEGTLSINTPTADDGYRICSTYLDPTNPQSGQLRAEYLTGIREFMFSFTARDSFTANNLRTWQRNQTDLEVTFPIIGAEANDYSLRIAHTRGRVVQQSRTLGAGGDFIGKTCQIALLGAAAGDGTIPFTATLVNNVASYIT
jgi:hypothetical protein